MASENKPAPLKPLPVKPLPMMTGYTKEFFDFCHQHELRFQRCKQCGTWRHVPRPMCAECHSLQWEWAKSAGKGKVYAWTTVYQALNPAFVSDVPYAAVIVGLEEGPRIASWVTNVPPDKLKVGMPVELWFDDVNDEVALPKFKAVGV